MHIWIRNGLAKITLKSQVASPSPPQKKKETNANDLVHVWIHVAI